MNKSALQYLKNHTIRNLTLADSLSDSDAEQETLRLFVETVEQAPIAISITDKKAKILYVNEEFCRVTGYKPADVLGENESLLSDKTTPRQMYHNLWRTISSKKSWQGQLVNRHKSGQRYLADLTIAPIVNALGAITHYIGMHRDITASHEAEKKVINQKLLIESVINSSPIAMVVLDDNDRVILDNQLYKALVSDLDKSEPAHFFLRLLRDEMEEVWMDLQDHNQGFTNREFRVETKGGHGVRWFSCAGNWFIENEISADAFFADNQKKYLILTLTDITKQRQHIEALHIQTLKTLMAEDERVRSIRETLLGAIHQIQMPMNQISAAEQILLHKRDEKNTHLINILQQIQKSGKNAVAKMQDCVPEIYHSAEMPVNLNQILHEVLLLEAQSLLTHNIEVQWRPLADLPNILGSENRLRILFKQLIDNAIAAIIQADNPDKQLSICTQTEADLLYVRIADSGNGIPADKHSKIFEPFYTTHKGSNTAGMGLVIAKEIVNQHHGLIDIDREVEQGCCFQLSFPLHKNSRREVSHD
ncbi:MAG: nitrogen fixation negative regulator NifL [Methylococcales bacterium]|nr:nitrogen fixation negative regulator NifL [Methylococcales bacterium]